MNILRAYRDGTKHPQLRIEQLEERANPSIPAAGLSPIGVTSAIFTDADGDSITVRVAGTAGLAVFTDGGGNPVDNGDDIAAVQITGASSDFTLTYTLNTDGAGADTVAMGNITSNRPILGVYSVARNNAGVLVGNFVLRSFIGPSLSINGSINADDVVGNVDGVGIDLASLAAGRAINIRDAFDADLIIRGVLGGSVNVGGSVGAAAAFTVRGNVLPTGVLASVGGSFAGTVEVFGAFAGIATIGGNATGAWDLHGVVQRTGRLLADRWADVTARTDWGGSISAVSGTAVIEVNRNVLSTAVFDGFTDVSLTVGGSVLAGATVLAGDDIVATVTKNTSGNWGAGISISLTTDRVVAESRLSGGNDVAVTAAHGVNGAHLNAANAANLNIAQGGLSNSIVTANGALNASIVGPVANSQLASEFDATVGVTGSVVGSVLGSGSFDLELTVSGSVTRTTLFSQESDVTATIGGGLVQSVVIGGDADDVRLTVNGNIDRTEIHGPSDVTVNVGGSLIRSRVMADESGGVTVNVGQDVIASTVTVIDSDLTMTVGRNVVSSKLTADDDITLTVGNDLSRSRVTSMDSDVRITVARDMVASVISATESNATVTVGRNMTASAVSADNDVQVSVTGNLSGLVSSPSSDVTLTVGGAMSGTAVAATNMVADLGSLNGTIASENLDLEVTGNVGARSQIQAVLIDDLNADTIGFKVGGSFAGTLSAGTLDSDEAGTSTLIGAGVLATGSINIRALGGTADENFAFNGNYLGSLNISGNIDVDLSFQGNLNRLTIGGSVGTTGAANVIFVGGRLTYLSSNSLFVPTLAGFDGNFRTGLAVVTGSLDTVGGFVKVVPIA